MLYNPQLLIESNEWLGDNRRDAQRKQISRDLIEEIKLLFQEKMEENLEIHLTELKDYSIEYRTKPNSRKNRT
ncbi:MAG: hypothetical protein AUH25_04795 [Thaumarchaeota archaeon 13_1_40CM_38_12]|nr:MAG: hypothetical protein AUH25_04795 [Thaumarchaeota archaeon 13_1_40CM_38_12]